MRRILADSVPPVGRAGDGDEPANTETGGYPSNHSHPSADWAAGVWHCTGRMDLWRACTAGSTNEECQPVCD